MQLPLDILTMAAVTPGCMLLLKGVGKATTRYGTGTASMAITGPAPPPPPPAIAAASSTDAPPAAVSTTGSGTVTGEASMEVDTGAAERQQKERYAEIVKRVEVLPPLIAKQVQRKNRAMKTLGSKPVDVGPYDKPITWLGQEELVRHWQTQAIRDQSSRCRFGFGVRLIR